MRSYGMWNWDPTKGCGKPCEIRSHGPMDASDRRGLRNPEGCLESCWHVILLYQLWLYANRTSVSGSVGCRRSRLLWHHGKAIESWQTCSLLAHSMSIRLPVFLFIAILVLFWPRRQIRTTARDMEVMRAPLPWHAVCVCVCVCVCSGFERFSSAHAVLFLNRSKWYLSSRLWGGSLARTLLVQAGILLMRTN